MHLPLLEATNLTNLGILVLLKHPSFIQNSQVVFLSCSRIAQGLVVKFQGYNWHLYAKMSGTVLEKSLSSLFLWERDWYALKIFLIFLQAQKCFSKTVIVYPGDGCIVDGGPKSLVEMQIPCLRHLVVLL